MRVVKLKQQHHILTGSTKGFTKGVSNSDGIGWKDGGVFDDNEEDM